ncbi:hypothetical protein [Streptomyces sp. NPDC048332]|uniref:hypothetical protein n=1 Tax=Streptomyces sp. NPDC048332 TaxID=3154619 RepID=UPI0034430F1B
MSNDNVAVLTTLNGAVLLIGTVQYTKLMQRSYQAVTELQRQRLAKRAALMDAKRRGEEYTVDDLLKLGSRQARRELGRSTPVVLASVVWFSLCGLLLESQLRMLRWIGTANAGPDPDLAESSFYVTAISIAVLVVEGYFVSITEALWRALRTKRAHRALYNAEERSDLHNAIRAAQRPAPAPLASPPTGSPGPAA